VRASDKYAIGIDVGGTKCAGGLIILPQGDVVARRLQPTQPERSGEAVLADVIEMVRLLQDEAVRIGVGVRAVGVGVAELVGLNGQVLSDATIRWKGIAVAQQIQSETRLPVFLDADVRAAARGEACLGAGRNLASFLYVTIGTGISASLVINAKPYAGARGLTGTFASSPPGLIMRETGELAIIPPLEKLAAGPALVERMAEARTDFAGTAEEVLALAAAGDAIARTIVASAGQSVGLGIAQLVNVLDPEAVIIGGGLGLAAGLYRTALAEALRRDVWSEYHRDIPLLSAQLGVDAGIFGAALGAMTIEEN
jgi:glucokinase